MRSFFRRTAALAAGAAVLLSLSGCGEEEKQVGNIGDVKLEEGDVYAVISIMDYGDITAKLFPEAAPESAARFIAYSEQGYYDMKNIHRVIDNFAIQGGSLNGDGTDGEIPDADYVPIEVNENARHFYGALCFAANSKGSFAQFYIVDNNTPQDITGAIESLSAQLADESIVSRLLPEDKQTYEEYLNNLKKMPEAVLEKYETRGGLYALDGKETVFGQVIDGFDVLEKISGCEVVTGNEIDDRNKIASKPLDEIVIEKVEIIRIEPEVTEETTTKKGQKTTTTTQIVAETVETTTTEATTPVTEHTLDTLVSIETTQTPDE